MQSERVSLFSHGDDVVIDNFHIGPEAGGVEFKYDALGRRIEKRVINAAGADAVTRYVYDGARVVEEYGGTGLLQADYVHGNYIDEVLRMRRDTTGDGTWNTTYWYQHDV